MKVALVVMPFYSTEAPAVGVSLLKAGLADAQIPCDVLYLNIAYAKRVGREISERVCVNKSDGGDTLLGDWVFAAECFPGLLPPVSEYLEYLRRSCPETADYHAGFLHLRKSVKGFIESCVDSVRWEQYDVIGFTTTFDQTVASLLLARRLKRLFPDTAVVFGGANCDGPMGVELHRQFPFIDFVCSGEADTSFVELVRRIQVHRPVVDIPGIVIRTDEQSALTSCPEPVQDLDALPIPDYHDYFEQFRTAFQAASGCVLPMETSRGCWWGAKSQCRFCGLNPQAIEFRSKTPARILSELSLLVRDYKTRAVTMTDNILDMAAFREFLPALKRLTAPVQVFYEVKANLRHDHVIALADAGVRWVQPGIESLNSHSLRLMGKGVSALQNVCFLRNCVQLGVQPIWNVITGIPGETEQDYRLTVELIRAIPHLPPPGGHAGFCMQRFSPYFQDPGKYGLLNVRPKEAYRFVYPLSNGSIANLAYYFDFDYRPDVRPPAARAIDVAISEWRQQSQQRAFLRSRALSRSSLLIETGRDGTVTSRQVLDHGQKEIYEYCAEVQSFGSIIAALRKQHGHGIGEEDLQDFLDAVVALRLMAREGDAYLSLAVPAQAPVWSAANFHQHGAGAVV